MKIFDSNLSYKDKISLLMIARGKNIGPVTFKNAMEISNNNISKCFQYFKILSERLTDKSKNILANKNEVEIEYEKTIKFGADFLFIVEDDYPYLLKQVTYAPIVITYKGDASFLNKKLISIVGSRNPSLNGLKIAEKITNDLCESGFFPVSGMAFGIDKIVHETAIKNNFKNAAVFGCGIDCIYPKENSHIYKALSNKNNGIILSEFKFGTKPLQYNFPRRNLIIAGLSIGTCVIQASKKSGALITADFALDNGREVFAVPGSILDNKSQGTNLLIKNGANMVLSSDDIIQVLSNLNFDKKNNLNDSKKNNIFNSFDQISFDINIQNSILKLIDNDPVSIKEIINYTNFGYTSVINALIELEISGKIKWTSIDSVALLDQSPSLENL